MSARSLVPFIALVALIASACTQSPIEPQARAIFGNATGTGLTLVADRQSRSWIVRRVWKGSPAAKAGIREGDRVRGLNGVTLPQTEPSNPCGPELLTEPVRDVRSKIDKTGSTGVLRVTLERDGRPMELSIGREPMAALYSRAKAPSGGSTQDPIICMLCDKNCPGALNNEGYWTCVISDECDGQTVQCKDPCLTS